MFDIHVVYNDRWLGDQGHRIPQLDRRGGTAARRVAGLLRPPPLPRD